VTNGASGALGPGQREDAIGGGLRDIAAEAMRCRHHQLQYRVDDRARRLPGAKRAM
jgi:hypothetical protein